MSKYVALAVAAAVAAAALPASAELQNVVVGGSITIEGDYWAKTIDTRNTTRWLPAAVPLRPLAGGPGIVGWAAMADTNSWSTVTQRTRLNVCADFTDAVSAFIEFESVDLWGEDFRSNYVTGVDARAMSNDDIEVYQAYIDVDEMFGLPLRARLGRQELVFGSGWLFGNNDFAPVPFAWGLSYDAIRLTYAVDAFSVDAFWAKLAENSPMEEDGDVDLYGVYASYLGIENVTIDAYWALMRDSRKVRDTNLYWPAERVEDLLGLDDYDVTNLHTVGLRGAGTVGQFDFEAEAAYQFGEADQVGGMFVPWVYGDDNATYDNWGVNAEVGYTIDMAWQPRVHLGYAWFEGEDNSDITFAEWINPFDMPDASVSFNRLASDYCYNLFLGASELSNVHVFAAGVEATPTEKIWVGLNVRYLMADEVFNPPVHFDLGNIWGTRVRVPYVPLLSFWTENGDDDLGWETSLEAAYAYSEDLTFSLGWFHYFVGEGVSDGSFLNSNGLAFSGSRDDDDDDYVYWAASLSF